MDRVDWTAVDVYVGMDGSITLTTDDPLEPIGLESVNENDEFAPREGV